MRVTFRKFGQGLQWIYESESGDTLSIVCHEYSYGGRFGKFETMCSWQAGVQGSLTFGEVQRKINTIVRRENRAVKVV